ncbi:MAG: SH3 domain-containing protein, partial [Candidatus Kryptoniota bacterium]
MADDDRQGHYESADSIELFKKRLKKSLRIDARYSVVDFKYTKNFLHIFTDSVAKAIRISRIYRKEFSGSFTSANTNLKIKVILLPDKSVGKFTRGICHVGVAPVRSSNASSGEQTTQVLYGESFDSLQITGEWIRVRLHADGYIGWVSANQVTVLSEEEFSAYQSVSKAYVVEKIMPLTEKPGRNSRALREREAQGWQTGVVTRTVPEVPQPADARDAAPQAGESGAAPTGDAGTGPAWVPL